MSVTGEPGGRRSKVGVPLTDLGAGTVRAVGDPRGAALPHSHRPRAVHRHVAGRGGRRAVGLGGGAVLRGGRHAAAARARRIGCSRRIRRSAAPTATSRSARPTTGCSSGSASCSAIRSGPPIRTTPTTRCACATARRSSSGSKRSPPRSRARTGWRASRRAGIPCGPINDYARGVRRSAGARARHGRRDRSPDARPHADARARR